MFWRTSIVVLIALAGCSGEPDSKVEQPIARTPAKAHRPKPSSDYAGSESCRECHAAIADEYATHPMAHSLTPIGKADLGEDYSDGTRFSPGYGLEYVVEKLANGHVLHHERQLSTSGDELYDQAEEVVYAVGSGAHECRYLLQKGGLLFLSPISWYGQEHQWGLSPVYELPNHVRFEGRATDACLSCHAGLMNKPSDARDVFAPDPFDECSIGCERCHGPGGSHIKFQRKELVADADPIANPAKLDAERRDAVCFQCHLQSQMRVARSDYNDFDFRPGMHFSDVWLAFLASDPANDPKTPAVSHAEQMLSSRCYGASQGALGCISCHDPHRKPSGDEAVGFYRSKCIACHEGPSRTPCSVAVEERTKTTAEDSCIVCHMPQVDGPDVAHVIRTDHRVLRKPSASPVSKEPATPERPREKYARLFVDAKSNVPTDEVERAWVVFLGSQAFETRNSDQATLAVDIANKLAEKDPGDRALATSLGQAYDVLKKDEAARAVWKDALAVWERDEPLLELMARSFQRSNRQVDAGEYFLRVVEINPFHSEALAGKAQGAAKFAGPREGVDIAKQALRVNRSLVDVELWLGEVHSVMGENALAAEFRRHAYQIKAARDALAPAGKEKKEAAPDGSGETTP